jgi:quercetin dioxygenase-like cupin family protein
MSAEMQSQSGAPSSKVVRVAAGGDRFGERRGLGINTIDFKVATQDSSDTFIIEMTIWERGGPPRHIHPHQDEWFYLIEGEFAFEIGDEKFTLKAGESMLAPRGVPHVWAYIGDARGKMLIAFMPAGKMEAFFRETTQANAMPPRDPALWRRYDMEVVGPPLPVE